MVRAQVRKGTRGYPWRRDAPASQFDDSRTVDTIRRFDNNRIMKIDTAVTLLAALAQGSRLALFRLLVQKGPQGMAAGEIAERLGVAPNTLSFHLKELSNAGLLKSRQEGRYVYYAPDFKAMNGLLAYLTENCCAGSKTPAACTSLSACKEN